VNREEISRDKHAHRDPAMPLKDDELERVCTQGAELVRNAKTVEDLIYAGIYYQEAINAVEHPTAELYTGLGDALLTRFYKFESEHWELLDQAYIAYMDALALEPGYRPAAKNIQVMKRFNLATGNGEQFPERHVEELEEDVETKPDSGIGTLNGELVSFQPRFISIFSILSNWKNLIPVLLVCCFFLIAIFAPLISPPSDPNNPLPFKLIENIEKYPLPPGNDALLGTAMYYPSPDMLLHYDVFHSVVWGTRDALRFGLIVALFSALLGTLIGAVSGYIGGIFNDITMRFTDAFLAFPIIAGVWLIQQLVFSFERTGSYLVAWYPNIDAVVAPLTARQRFITAIGLNPVLIAFILFSWMAYARLINAGFLRLKTADYIMAARTIGASHWRVIIRHLLPNAITPIIVLLARDIGAFVVLRAAFSFIGMGGSILSGLPEWDRILLLGRTWVIGVGGDLLLYWWLYLPVTITLVLFGISWNMLGDRLNVLLNPREEN
jgi:peptide/nickel transport system permease protein